jgi:EEF1A lysine methyltransferase 4
MAFGLVERLAQLKARRTVATNLHNRRDYGSIQYWDLRYTTYVQLSLFRKFRQTIILLLRTSRDTEPFDWYEKYRGSDIQILLRKRLKKDKSDVILNIGCGNSRLAEDLTEDGFEKYVFVSSRLIYIISTITHTHKKKTFINSVTNIDISSVVIEQMTEKYKSWMPKLRWYTMNTSELRFEDAIFDVCLDKATLDSIICSSSSGSAYDRAFRIHSMLQEISRCMKKNSVYIVISHGSPERRLRLLEKKEYGWTVEVEMIRPDEALGAPEGRMYYVYICTKGTRHVVPDTGDYRSLA